MQLQSVQGRVEGVHGSSAVMMRLTQSSPATTRSFFQPTCRRGRTIHTCSAATRDVSGDLLGSIATFALKTRLQSFSLVDTIVDCTSWGLVQGNVEHVALRGRHWRSPMNLTAEVLEADVSRISINYSALLFEQKIALNNIPVGDARVVFNQGDFANFVRHPLMTTATATAVKGRPFTIDPDSVLLDSFFGPCGCLAFEGVCALDGHTYKVTLMPAECTPPQLNLAAKGSSQGAVRPLTAVATHVPQGGGTTRGAEFEVSPNPVGSSLIETELVHFFTTLCMDLQGAELHYKSMAVKEGHSAGEGDLLELSLTLRVRDFPPPNLEF